MRALLLTALIFAPSALAQDVAVPDLLELEPFMDGSGKEALRGVYRVRENRAHGTGPWLELDLVVLLATGLDPAPDPIFILHGGPGAAASGAYRGYMTSWMRERRDIVLVDQRGTGGNHALRCPLDDEDPQSYLSPGFDEDFFRDCMQHLGEAHDLTQYTTPLAAHDLNEVRLALGYEQINLIGGSYGTRMALVAMREHPEMVRTALLDGGGADELHQPALPRHVRPAGAGTRSWPSARPPPRAWRPSAIWTASWRPCCAGWRRSRPRSRCATRAAARRSRSP